MTTQVPAPRITVPELHTMKARGEPIAMITAYDATFAQMLEEAGADVLLVGDSLGMVVQGHASTLPVTVDEVIYHCRAVARSTKRALIVGDMPFMSWQLSPRVALQNAARFLSEGGAHAVKLEGGEQAVETIRRLVAAGVPVMAHVGLLPQSVHAMGGFRVQGRGKDAGERVLRDAQQVAAAGAFAVLLEGIPADLARTITESIDVPTIGIGAGVHCGGQVLVCYDLLGLTPQLKPKFVARYAEFFTDGVRAARAYCEDVKARRFPTPKHSFGDAPSRTTAGPSYGPQDS